MIELDRLLRVSNQLVGLHGGSEPAVAHAKLGLPVQLNDEGWQLLERFRSPTTPSSVLEKLGLVGDARLDVLLALSRFVEAGLLVGPDEADYLHDHWLSLAEPLRPLFLPADAGFLRAPGGEGPADFQVLGVALDRAARVAGAARGPAALRDASNALPAHLDPRTAAFRGLWDHDAERILLEGARFRDHGNVYVDASASTDDAYQSIHAAVRRVLERSPGVPIVLGGDHSITEPILRALTEAGDPLFIVHFDAHTDMSPAYRGRAHHHGSVMDRVRRMEAVTGILQIGVRDFGPPWWRGADKTRVISCARAQRIDEAELLGSIPENSRCYVSIDIDVLDPSEAPGTGVPVPGGLRLLELERLLEAIGSARRVIGLDLVEVAPDLDHGRLTSLCGVRALIRLLDAIHRAKG